MIRTFARRLSFEYSQFQENDIYSSTSIETGARNKLVLILVLKVFPEAHRSRRNNRKRATRLDTPILVSQLCYPGMPTVLNLFEWRYRLILRRCLSKPNPCFGIIPPPRPIIPVSGPSSSLGMLESPSPSPVEPEYGTMLEIRNVWMLPDGQCRVETWGMWRFRILEMGNLDGYRVARIERVDDLEGEEESLDELPSSSAHTSNQELMALCHAFLDQLGEGTPSAVQHLDHSYLPIPEDPTQFSFWMALLLPMVEHEKAKLLRIRSPRLRLRLVVHWIEQLSSNWWLFNGRATS